MNQCCSETIELDAVSESMHKGDDEDDGRIRQLATTSPLDAWLWRGEHPIVKDMPWYVYSMWVFRVEKMPLKLEGEAVTCGEAECSKSRMGLSHVEK